MAQQGAYHRYPKGQRGQRGRLRAVTLIEILVVVALIALLVGGMTLGLGMRSSSRLEQSASLVAGAVRVAYNHANATSRPVRLVFDFDDRSIALEEGDGPMVLRQNERTGGAEGTTDLEKDALEEAAAVVEGPQAPRATFKPAQAFGLDPDEGNSKKRLANGIYFRQIEVDHEDDPVKAERVYLYFWPGGQTERAAIVLQIGSETNDNNNILTLLVSPLTGKVSLSRGERKMARPRTDEEASEREDSWL